ncbi:hypothetical protein JCM8547_008087 [Rhodosporidiobolus lusitaniae]
MDFQVNSTPSAPTSTAPQRKRQRGPAATSCTACRARKSSCKRTEDGGSCEGCQKRGLVCSMSGTTSNSSAPPAKRNDTAKTSYSSLPSSTSSSLALVPSGLETRLADNEMSETLGLELLQIYGDAGNTCSDPLYPPPVLDYLALQGRYEAAGKRLADLSIEDQLTCRIVFASASRLWRSGRGPNINHKLVQQLVTSAQTRADAAGIWRSPSSGNATNLLLLHLLSSQGEIGSETAKPYLISLAAQSKTLNKIDANAIVGQGESAPALGWCMLLFDTFAAIERKEVPCCSQAEFERLLGRRGGLPSMAAVEFALQNDPWSTTTYCLRPLALFVQFGRRLAYLFELTPNGVDTVERCIELNEIWGTMTRICAWAAEAAKLQATNPFSLTVLQLYLNLIAGAAIFAQLAIVEHQEQASFSLPPSFPAPTRAQFASHACSYLRSVRIGGRKTFLAVFTGTTWSVSRLAAFTDVFNGTSAWDESLHPAGPSDKLESLIFLCKTLASVLRAYDSAALRKSLLSLEAEKNALEVLLGHSPDSASSDSSSEPAVSMGRLSTWTHILDKEERKPVEFFEDPVFSVPPAEADASFLAASSIFSLGQYSPPPPPTTGFSLEGFPPFTSNPAFTSFPSQPGTSSGSSPSFSSNSASPPSDHPSPPTPPLAPFAASASVSSPHPIQSNSTSTASSFVPSPPLPFSTFDTPTLPASDPLTNFLAAMMNDPQLATTGGGEALNSGGVEGLFPFHGGTWEEDGKGASSGAAPQDAGSSFIW